MIRWFGEERKIMTKPYTNVEVACGIDKEGYLTGVIRLDAQQMNKELEDFLDLLTEKMVESGCMSDITWKIIGSDDKGEHGGIILEVRGCPEFSDDLNDE